MQDHLTLGLTPCGEACAQVGREDYPERSRKEARAYIGQLQREHPGIPDSCSFRSKSFPHDFGSYREVVVTFDPDDEESARFAFDVEGKLPEEWDEIARTELELVAP